MDAARPPHTAVVGLGWGDEGKGKIVDLLSPQFDVVVRYNGGANAGHTVCADDETFALHQVPSGVLHQGVAGVIAPGVALDPLGLLAEIDALQDRGVTRVGVLNIRDRAHRVVEYHKVEDRLAESSADDETRIGTTARGIGPCYADKMRRSTALRVGDLLDRTRLQGKLDRIVTFKRRMFRALYDLDVELDGAALYRQLCGAAERLGPFICDTTAYLREAIDADRRLLFEGANGMLLDVDHGTYPFVTSSSTGPWGICAGGGVPPGTVGRSIGVIKTYATRVGSGPFPSELDDLTGDRIREQGREFGTTTGRPRRCGWFDAVAVRHGVHLGGVTEVALMHLDTLGGFDRLGICTAYRHGGRTFEHLPADSGLLERVEPVLEMHQGWSEDLRPIRRPQDLPDRASRYIERLEVLIEAPITLVSVGPDRTQTLTRQGRSAK